MTPKGVVVRQTEVYCMHTHPYPPMNNPALIVTQSGRLTPGLSALVAAQEYGPVSTLVTNRPENGQYYLSPATITQIERRTAEWDHEPLIVVDGTPHPGQLVDLQARLQSTPIVDLRRVVWERLAGENPVAATRVLLQEARITRRQAANAQRGAATRGPSGTSGRVAESDERIQTLCDRLKQQQTAVRRRVRTGHTAVDARVVLLGGVDAPTTPLWSELTGRKATAAVGLPAQAKTAQTTVGPHTVAVTDTPGIPGSNGVPQWLRDVLPGMEMALEQATCVLGVGEDAAALAQAVASRFAVPCRLLAQTDAAAARTALDDLLASVTFAIRLPYGDDAQSLVSELHDDAVVHATEYSDAIYVRLEVAQTTTEQLRRRVTNADGELKQLETSVDTDGTQTPDGGLDE